jgi:hypothetical protein
MSSQIDLQRYRDLGLTALVVAAVLGLLFWASHPRQPEPPEIAFSESLDEAESQRVSEVEIRGREICGRCDGDGAFTTQAPVITPELISRLLEREPLNGEDLALMAA